MKNLEYVTHSAEMLCGLLKSEWPDNGANYHFLGVPLDISSTYRSGARHGPDAFRKILRSENFECIGQNGLDLSGQLNMKDWGNVGVITTDLKKSLSLTTEGVSDLIRTEQPFLIFGGDHSITIGIGQAFENAALPFHCIYVDAHLDLYSKVMESQFSHACTLRRLSEMNQFRGATVLGYRDFTGEQLVYAKNNNIETLSTNELSKSQDLHKFGFETAQSLISSDVHVHVSIDLDVLDPSYAPGVGNPVAGGLNTREILWLITGIFEGLGKDQLISWDIVEYNPIYDQAEISGFAIVKLLIESLSAQFT